MPPGSIYCIGRNYAQHAKELGNAVPDDPIVFLKPQSALASHPAILQLPESSNDVHHEVELVIAIGTRGKKIAPDKAGGHIAGFGIGIDFTARDIQSVAKSAGLPWAVAKGFDGFAPLSDFIPYDGQDLTNTEIRLTVNGTLRQHGTTNEMIFSIPHLISYLSGIFTLYPGDLIFTGTPAGVAKVVSGDVLIASITNQPAELRVEVR